jgi:superfamily I DNA and/or RNA helicase
MNVAMTRARRKLLIVGCHQAPNTSHQVALENQPLKRIPLKTKKPQRPVDAGA